MRPVEEFLRVDSDHRSGHHPEVGERRIAATNRGPAEEDMPETICLRDLLHLRPGIGDGHEMATGIVCAHSLFRAVEEILFEDVGFERAARLAGNNEERFGNVDFLLKCLHLRRIGGVENVQVRVPGTLAESHPQNFRTQA